VSAMIGRSAASFRTEGKPSTESVVAVHAACDVR
jgi:hypothetical protein